MVAAHDEEQIRAVRQRRQQQQQQQQLIRLQAQPLVAGYAVALTYRVCSSGLVLNMPCLGGLMWMARCLKIIKSLQMVNSCMSVSLALRYHLLSMLCVH